MWHGVSEYLLFVALVSLALHSVSGKYVACTLGGAAACSILNLAHEAWLANWQINPGWGPPMFVVGAMLALPVSALAGLPLLGLRHLRKRTSS